MVTCVPQGVHQWVQWAVGPVQGGQGGGPETEEGGAEGAGRQVQESQWPDHAGNILQEEKRQQQQKQEELPLINRMMQGARIASRNNPPSSSASSDGNDEAAMAVIMSLLEVGKLLTLENFY